MGVDNGFSFVSSGKRLGRLLYRGIFRIGPSYDDYRDPLSLGLIPFPIPYSTAVRFPLPFKVRYIVGKPMTPECGVEAGDNPELVQQFADRVENCIRNLLGISGIKDMRLGSGLMVRSRYHRRASQCADFCPISERLC